METAAATRRPAEQVHLPALERGLDSLAQQVRADVEPQQFFKDVLRLLVHTARADEAVLWLRANDSSFSRFALDVAHLDGHPTSEHALTAREWMGAVLEAGAAQHTRFTDGDGEHQRVTAPIRQGGAPVGVLEALFHGAALPTGAHTLVSYAGAVSELVGDFLVQHELRLLRRERAEWKQWDDYLAALQSADSLPRMAELIAHEGRALTGSERVSVLRLRGGWPRVLAVSGADTIDARSSTVQAQERIAYMALSAPANLWCGVEGDVSPAVQRYWDRLQHVAGTTAAGVLPLRSGDGAVYGILICERFRAGDDAAAWKSKCEMLQRFTSAVWAAASERSLGFLSRMFRRRRGFVARSARGIRRAVTLAAVLGGATAALTLIPAELVITGEGKLLPAERRDVFATTTGIVEEVRVSHGDRVAAGDTLLVLRDPDAELEATRITGELATARARLTVVQAARISGSGASSDPALRAQQLTGEEEELRQKVASLTKQQELLEAEKELWTLASPLDGQVLTWDVEPVLAGRPVQRGQVLLEVGATAGDWIVEVRLRERDAGAVLDALSTSQDTPVQFVPVTGQRWTAEGTVREVARVTDTDDRGESSVRLIVKFDRRQVPELRPGKTVLPKIACGQHPVGYVWFRDLIETARRLWWQWW